MNPTRPLADRDLTLLLADLIAEEALPHLDRWYARRARSLGWSPDRQRRLWQDLRRALTRVYALVPETSPAATSWPGLRRCLRAQVGVWALRAGQTQVPLTPVEAGIPPWLGPAFDERRRRSAWSDDQTRAFLAAQSEPAPLYLRPRPDPAGRAAQETLRAEGWSEASDLEGFDRLRGREAFESRPEFQTGLVEIQDAASQLSLARLGLRPGQRVWDVCAGAGGKTLWAAGELRGRGVVVATEVAAGRLTSLKDRVRRSGYQNVRVQAWAGRDVPDFGPEGARAGGFDRVFVDAPCSASGTWRRDPEARFRLTPSGLAELGGHQARLLRLGWSALKSGGRLAYVTCSWLVAENEAVVEAFSQEVGTPCDHQELLGLPAFDANTMFVALWEKP